MRWVRVSLGTDSSLSKNGLPLNVKFFDAKSEFSRTSILSMRHLKKKRKKECQLLEGLNTELASVGGIRSVTSSYFFKVHSILILIVLNTGHQQLILIA